jgi:phosphoglycerate dehydrogenase-like enzyme
MPFTVIDSTPYLTDEARSHLEENGCQVRTHEIAQLTETEMCEALRGIDAAIAGGEYYTEKVFQEAGRLKIVARTGVGFDHVDIVAAAKHGAWVTTTPGATSPAVADFTLALILCLLRDIPTMSRDMRAGKWNPFAGGELASLTLGVVGTGSIGREVIQRAAGFGGTLLAYDIQQDDEFAKQWNVQYVTLDELMTQSDIVSLHVPANEETIGLIDERRIQLMKQEAYLVNTSRPNVVVKDALVRALEANAIKGAAIDVHDTVPCRPNDPLVRLNNVIATPWAAYKTQEAIENMCISAARDVVTVLQGGVPKYPVNKVLSRCES